MGLSILSIGSTGSLLYKGKNGENPEDLFLLKRMAANV
jgi:hypothetical protein